MIVHLFEDQKFVDSTIINFEHQSKGLNKYIVFSNTQTLNYVTKKDNVSVLKNSSYDLNLDFIYKDCNLLVIHFLTPIKLYVIKNKPAHVKVLWSIWGADAYDHFNQRDFFEPITKNIQKNNFYSFFRFSILYDFYHLFRYRVKTIRRELGTLKKIDFISTVLPYEFELIQKEFSLNAEYIPYSYSVNLSESLSSVSLGDGVLIGNSATLSNNHLDIFETIKGVENRLIVPLSYGAYGYKDYRNIVFFKGKKIFGKNLKIIDSFLSIEEYDKVLLSCNTMIMYHLRQQALGNIYKGLYLGLRVFLNKKSITYKYLIDLGMIVFDLEKDKDLLGIELDQREKDVNKDLIIKIQGVKAISSKIDGIINLHYSLTNNIDY